MSLLEMTSVSFAYEGKPILRSVDFRVAPGEVVALVGPNGAGKSTLLLMATGGGYAYTGEITLKNQPIEKIDPLVLARTRAFLAQHYEAAWLIPVQELVALGRHAWGGRHYDRLPGPDRAIVDEVLARTDMDALRHAGVRHLSGGEQGRANLARILATKAELILADEPCAALDPRHQLDALAILREEAARGVGVVIALHDLDLAERFADRIVVMDKGRIVANGPASTALTETVLAEVFAVKRRAGGGFETV